MNDISSGPLTLADCDFYHSFDLPTGQHINGQWDLRGRESTYLGGVNFSGKRVLEIGPASGFLSFYMERQGANVTAVDLPLTPDSYWDLVRRPGQDWREEEDRFIRHVQRVRNSFWYAHAAFNSKNVLIEADSTRLPADLGTFDVGVICSVLLHAAAPVSIVNSLVRHVTDTLIIAEPYYESVDGAAICALQPAPENTVHNAWWQFSPKMIENLIGVLGYTDTVTTRYDLPYSSRPYQAPYISRPTPMFTVVGRRGGP